MKLDELTQKLSDRMRLERKAESTIESYVATCAIFFDYLVLHPETKAMDYSARMESFLTWRVSHDNISPSTQDSNYWALRYLGEKVLGTEVRKIRPLRAKERQRVPHIISRDQVRRFLDQLPGTFQLMGRLMYGTGIRIQVDCLRLRIKDINFSLRKLIVHESKGDKDRIIPLPDVLVDPLQSQVAKALEVWKEDRYHRVNGVQMPNALDRKYPGASVSKDWFWVFPNPNLGKDRDGVVRRHHVYYWDVADQFIVTRRKLGLPEYVTPHALRHFFATHFMEDLFAQRIPQSMAEAELIKWMGHVDPRTLKYYVHLAAPRSAIVKSPLDMMEGNGEPQSALYSSTIE